MVPEKYRLESIGRFLLAAFERRRPGLTEWTPALERELLAECEAELAAMETQCRELGVDDKPYWQKARRLMETVLLPRYAALAKEELKLARAGYHLWRNGDLLARAAFAATGLVLGAAAVAIPWIPVTEKWVPWTLFVLGPLLPDAQLWYYNRRYQKRLQSLIDDLANAGKSLETYRSIAELQQSLGAVEAAPDDTLRAVAEPPPQEAKAEPVEELRSPSKLKH